MSLRLFIALSCAVAAVAAPPLTVQLGEPPRAAPPGLAVSSSTQGSDTLECLHEGEWSVGEVTLRATAPAPDAGPLTVRIAGGAELAPVPTLVRRGERETYVRNTHREGADVVAALPWPGASEAHYELVDLSSSVEWKLDPALEADPLDRGPLAGRRALIFIPADDEPPVRRARDWRFAPFRVVRESQGYGALLSTTKPYVYHYPSYRGPAETASALVRLVRGLDAAKVALIAHGNGASIMRRALESPALTRRVTLSVTLSDSTPAALFSTLSAR